MRIVEEKHILTGTGRLRSGEDIKTDVNEYLDRVAKYVPAEVVSAYITANGMATLKQPDPGILFIFIFLVCWVSTPIYISRFTRTRKEAWTNGIMSFFAFLIWAYATGGGIFNHLGWYDAPTASVILILFTLVSGFIQPVVEQKPPNPTIIQDD